MSDLQAPGPAEIQARVRRFAVLRAAQRALRDVAPPGELDSSLALGRRLLSRLRGLSGEGQAADILDAEEALRGVDDLLTRLAERIRDVLKETPTRALCNSLAPIADSEPGTIRALGAVVLETDLDSDTTLSLVEFLVTALACTGAAGERKVVRTPLDAMPELADVDAPQAHEADPEIDEAEQILGRAIRRIDTADVGATRDRIRDYKRRLGLRILHPTVMAAAVAYNNAMGNRLARLIEEHRSLDAFAETLLGPDDGDAELHQIAASGHVVLPTGAAAATKSRLFWHSLATVGLSVGLLVLALFLWPRSDIERLPTNSAVDISQHLAAGYVSPDDGAQRFVGTVGASWQALDGPERQRVVARIAARLAARGVESVTLVDGDRQLQARHEGETLLWLRDPAVPSQ
jgi:hypothetical protein